MAFQNTPDTRLIGFVHSSIDLLATETPTFESSMVPEGRGVGIGEEEMEGADPVVPFKIFWKRHLKRAARKTICAISSGKTSRFNCPGRLALVTQILSPVLTGKLIAEKNGE